MAAQQPVHAGGRQAGRHERHGGPEGKGISEIEAGQLQGQSETRHVGQTRERICQQHGGSQYADPVWIGQIASSLLHGFILLHRTVRFY